MPENKAKKARAGTQVDTIHAYLILSPKNGHQRVLETCDARAFSISKLTHGSPLCFWDPKCYGMNVCVSSKIHIETASPIQQY
jgi:hypothetical protein